MEGNLEYFYLQKQGIAYKIEHNKLVAVTDYPTLNISNIKNNRLCRGILNVWNSGIIQKMDKVILLEIGIRILLKFIS